ncbi:MAG: AMIN domain-containing protein [Desertifilum sp. SIO1I2]|nr:AMIN domain-containing protein [Desertifilum sp. SIO1I2]
MISSSLTWFVSQVGAIGKAIPVAIAASALLSTSAWASTLSQWEFNPTESRLEIAVQAGTTPRYFFLADPLRLVIDLPDTEVGAVPSQQQYSGIVQQIRVAQFQPGLTRIVMELSPGAVLSSQQAQLQLLESHNGIARWGIRPLVVGASPASPTRVSNTLPPATFWSATAPQVSVPPLTRRAKPMPSQEDAETPGASAADLAVQPRQAILAPSARPTRPSFPTPTLVPPAQSPPPPVPAQAEPPPQNAPIDIPIVANYTPTLPPVAEVPVIEFGEPLPRKDLVARTRLESSAGVGGSTGALVAPDARLILPSGTLLTLMYPGSVALSLRPGAVRQEVLLLQEEIRDTNGQILIPTGAMVIGRFEMDRQEVRFIAQAIGLGDRNLPLTAQSVPLNEGSAQIAIQPNQTLQVRLSQDLSRP